MRLLHVVHTLNPDRGGPSESVRMFVRAHQRAGNEVEVATLDGLSDGRQETAIAACPVAQCIPAGRAKQTMATLRASTPGSRPTSSASMA